MNELATGVVAQTLTIWWQQPDDTIKYFQNRLALPSRCRPEDTPMDISRVVQLAMDTMKDLKATCQWSPFRPLPPMN